MSLYTSFYMADVNYSRTWKAELENRILASKFVNMLESGAYYRDAYQVFGSQGITEAVYRELLKDAQEAEFFSAYQNLLCSVQIYERERSGV